MEKITLNILERWNEATSGSPSYYPAYDKRLILLYSEIALNEPRDEGARYYGAKDNSRLAILINSDGFMSTEHYTRMVKELPFNNHLAEEKINGYCYPDKKIIYDGKRSSLLYAGFEHKCPTGLLYAANAGMHHTEWAKAPAMQLSLHL